MLYIDQLDQLNNTGLAPGAMIIQVENLQIFQLGLDYPIMQRWQRLLLQASHQWDNQSIDSLSELHLIHIGELLTNAHSLFGHLGQRHAVKRTSSID